MITNDETLFTATYWENKRNNKDDKEEEEEEENMMSYFPSLCSLHHCHCFPFLSQSSS
jgi:hypothetical protein